VSVPFERVELEVGEPGETTVDAGQTQEFVDNLFERTLIFGP
jgi:hypothetical protein